MNSRAMHTRMTLRLILSCLLIAGSWHVDVASKVAGARVRGRVTFAAYGDGRSSGGWGDRVEGILTAYALAEALDREFYIHATHGWRLADFYNGTWNRESLELSGTAVDADEERAQMIVDCLHQRCDDCFLSWVSTHVSSKSLPLDLVYRGNFDCVDRLELALRRRLTPAREVFALLFSAPKFTYNAPQVAWHVRLGGKFTLDGKRVRNTGQDQDNVGRTGRTELREVAKSYWRCHNRLMDLYLLDASRPYLAMDSMDDGVRAVFGNVRHGTLLRGHAEKFPNSALATHVEFEILRHADLLLLDSGSGFSYVAHKTRANKHQIAYDGAPCRRAFEVTELDLVPFP